MTSIKVEPIPCWLFFFSTIFAGLVSFAAALPLWIQAALVLLCVMISLVSYVFNQKRIIVQASYLEAPRQWLLQGRDGKIVHAELLSNSFIGKFVLILNWRVTHTIRSAIFLRWQYDAHAWRKMQTRLLWR